MKVATPSKATPHGLLPSTPQGGKRPRLASVGSTSASSRGSIRAPKLPRHESASEGGAGEVQGVGVRDTGAPLYEEALDMLKTTLLEFREWDSLADVPETADNIDSEKAANHFVEKLHSVTKATIRNIGKAGRYPDGKDIIAKLKCFQNITKDAVKVSQALGSSTSAGWVL